ncbi:dihydrofolate reductase family protein [Streptomyces hypolithicus]
MARKLMAWITVSMDGFVTDPDGGMGWLVEHVTTEQSTAYYEGIWRGVDTVLLGRNNYEGFHGYWPPVARNPDAAPRDRSLATWLDEVEKVVFSRTLTSADWPGARIAQRNLEEEVRALKEAPGRNILVLNSVSIIQALLHTGQLDELHLGLVPAVLGGGRRLFPDGLPASAWRLDGTMAFTTGALDLTYRRR